MEISDITDFRGWHRAVALRAKQVALLLAPLNTCRPPIDPATDEALSEYVEKRKWEIAGK